MTSDKNGKMESTNQVLPTTKISSCDTKPLPADEEASKIAADIHFEEMSIRRAMTETPQQTWDAAWSAGVLYGLQKGEEMEREKYNAAYASTINGQSKEIADLTSERDQLKAEVERLGNENRTLAARLQDYEEPGKEWVAGADQFPGVGVDTPTDVITSLQDLTALREKLSFAIGFIQGVHDAWEIHPDLKKKIIVEVLTKLRGGSV